MTDSVIYKFGPFNYGENLTFCGTPVHVGLQNGEIYMWCMLVDEMPNLRERVAKRVGTGEPFQYTPYYYGTVVMPNGLVWHVIGAD